MKPSIPKGTRDFSPTEMLRRQYIFDTIRGVFQRYGFLPLETPAMENLATLTGKYGEEGDRLIFKIMNSGDAWGGVSPNVKERIMAGEPVPPGRLASELCEKALRYDLTVPFARYVVMHQNDLHFPFKRYQIQPVWRADRPQKGRYREFYQCDADMIGSTSLLNEVDLIAIISDVFERLGLRVKICINNRKILTGIAELFKASDRSVELITAMDKIDKVGTDGVLKALVDMQFSNKLIADVSQFYAMLGSIPEHEAHNREQLLRQWFTDGDVSIGLEGLNELHQVTMLCQDALSVNQQELVYRDISLARGLTYYTGTIFEVKALEGTLGSSICGGGRYDDLTGIFGLKNMSGVGISFGADRIYDVLLETNKFPTELGGGVHLLFANFGEKESMHCLKLLRTVREAGIAAELYPDQVKMAKQFKYANDKGIAYVAVIGESEMQSGTIALKNMKTGEQRSILEAELLSVVSS